MLTKLVKQLYRYPKLYRNISSTTDAAVSANHDTKLLKLSDDRKSSDKIEKHLDIRDDNAPPEDMSSYLKSGSVLASFVNDSDFIKSLLLLRVNFHKLEKNLDAIPFILSLTFETIRGHIQFFSELGIKKEIIGEIITKNPFILKEELDNLQVRINYLQYKKFDKDKIIRIVEKNPIWLSTSCQEIDKRLGFFQNTLQLTSDEVRGLAVTYPKLITYDLEKVNLNIFLLKEEMGFTHEEAKSIILSKPKLLLIGRDKISNTFDYVHTVMKIPLEMIAKVPEVLSCRKNRLQPRHMFLERLGRAQYNPKEPNYVGLVSLISGNDADFVTEVAKSSVQIYNAFLKSL